MAKKVPAFDVSYEVIKFLVELNSPKHALRENALKSFLKKMKIQGDEIYDDDVDIALVGKDDIHGLLAWTGEKSKNHGTALKRSSGPAMCTLHSLITSNMGEGLQDQNIWLSRLRCVNIEHLRCMSLESHILVETRKGGYQPAERGAMHEACIITQLLLESHFNAITEEPENLSLEDLLHSKEAQDIFMEEISSWKPMVQTSSEKKSPDSSRWMSPSSEGGTSPDRASRSYDDEEMMSTDTGKGTISRPHSSVNEKDRLILEENVPMNDSDPQTEPQQFALVHVAESLLQFLDGLKNTRIEEGDDKSLKTFCMDDPLALHPSFHLAIFQEALDTGIVPAGDEDSLPPPPASDDDSHIGNGEKEISTQRLRNKVFRYLQSKSKSLQNGFLSKSPRRNDTNTNSPSKIFKVFQEAPTEQREQLQLLESMGSIIPVEKSFQPEFFMSTVHPDTGLADLRKGLENLQKVKEKQVDQLNVLVKTNLNKFVRCSACIETYVEQVGKVLYPACSADSKQKSIVSSMSMDDGIADDSAFRSSSMTTLEGGNETKAENSLVFELSSLLDSAQFEAASEFSELLGKLDEIKEVRAAQSLLQRKRELFNVPSKMKACLESKKYEQMVKLYKFAYETSLGRIELKVRQEADDVAQAAHNELLCTLKSDTASIDDQIAAIGFLSMLGYANGDPILPLCICLHDQTDHFAQTVNDVCTAYYDNLESAYNTFNLESGFNRLVNVKTPPSNTAAAIDAARHKLKLGSSTSEPTVVGNVSSHPQKSSILPVTLNPREDLNMFRSVNGFNSLSPKHYYISTSPACHQSVSVDAIQGTEEFPVSSSSQYDVDSSVPMLNIARLKHIENICECLSSWIPHLAEISSHLISYELMGVQADSKSGSYDIQEPKRSLYNMLNADKTVQLLTEMKESDSYESSFTSLDRSMPCHNRILAHQRIFVFDKWLSGSAQDVFKTVLGTAADFLQDKYKSIFTPEEYASASQELVMDHLPAFVEKCLSFPIDKDYMRQALQSLAGLIRALNTCMANVSGTLLLLDVGVSNLKAAVLKIQEVYINYLSEKLWNDKCTLNCDMDEKCLSRNLASHTPYDLRHSKAFETIISQELNDLAALLPLPEVSAEQVSKAVSHALDGMLSGLMKQVSKSQDCCSYGIDMDNGSTAFSALTPLPDPTDHIKILFHCLAECLYMEQEGMPKLRALFKDLFGPTVVLEDISNQDNQALAENKDTILKHYLKHLRHVVLKYVNEAWWGHPRINISTAVADNTATQQQQQQSTTLTKNGGGTVIAAPLPSYLVKTLLMLVNMRSNASQYLGKWLFQTKPPATTSNLEEENDQPPSTYDVLYSDYLMRESVRLIMNIVCNCANKRILGSEDIGIRPLDGTNLCDIASRVAQIEFLRATLWRYIPSDTMERVSRSLQRLYHVIHDAASGGGHNDDGPHTNNLLQLKLKLVTKRISEESSKEFNDVVQQILLPDELANLLTVSKLQDSLRLYVCALR